MPDSPTPSPDLPSAPETPPAAQPTGPCCPRCGGPVARVPRRWMERLRSVLSPVRRYKCLSLVCGWSGTLPLDAQTAGKPAAERRREPGRASTARPVAAADRWG